MSSLETGFEYSQFKPTEGQQSTSKKKSTKNKKLVELMSIEDVFREVSTVVSSNINPPPGRTLMTPKSAEVCLKFGINPEILKIRDIDSFWESGIDPTVQAMRHEAYVQRRHEMMKISRKERNKMIGEELKSSTNLSSDAVGLSPEILLEQQKQQNSTLIMLEMQRMEKIKRRQEKEIEQMISYEVSRVKLQQEMEERYQEQKKNDELKKKQQQKQMKQIAEQRRLRELQRQAIEEIEEERRRDAIQKKHELDTKIAEEKERKLQEERKRMQREEEEKRNKHEEHKKKLENYYEEEQKELRRRLESIHEVEKKKHDRILEKQKEHAIALRKKRIIVEHRIERNIKMAESIEEKRKREIIEQQRQQELLRQENERKMEENRIFQLQEAELQEERKKLLLYQQKKLEEQKAAQLMEKFDAEQENVKREIKRQQKRISLMKEKKNIRNQMKLENVERVIRMNEHKRLSTLKRIEDTEDRVRDMEQKRLQLIEDRKKMATDTRLQKERLIQVMEELRADTTKANKIITKGVQGAISIDTLLKSHNSSLVSISNSRAMSVDRKRSKKKTTQSLSMLSDSRNSNSAEASMNPALNGVQTKFYTSYPNPDALPYISPYEFPNGLTSPK